MRCYRCDPAGVRDGPMCSICLTDDVAALRERVRVLEEKLRAPIPEGPALRVMAQVALKRGVYSSPQEEARAKEIAEAILAWSEGK